MTKYRLQKHNCSLGTPVWKWKLQFNRSGKWIDVRTEGKMKLFDTEGEGKVWIEQRSQIAIRF